MKLVRELFPGSARENIHTGAEMLTNRPGYDEILESFGYEILLQVDDEDYQGDSRVLFRDGDRYGFLTFGWGSCSGCDALQACDTYDDLQALYDRLHNDILWFDGPRAALHFVLQRDWEGQYSWYSDETRKFLTWVLKLLTPSDPEVDTWEDQIITDPVARIAYRDWCLERDFTGRIQLLDAAP